MQLKLLFQDQIFLQFNKPRFFLRNGSTLLLRDYYCCLESGEFQDFLLPSLKFAILSRIEQAPSACGNVRMSS